MENQSNSPIKYKLSLYMSAEDAVLVKTWYRYQTTATDIEERMCYVHPVPKDDIVNFMKGKRLDRFVEVKGTEGAFSLPSSHNLMIVKDSKFVDGGLSRNKGSIKLSRNNEKMVYIGTIALSKPDQNLVNMIASLDVNQHMKKEIPQVAGISSAQKKKENKLTSKSAEDVVIPLVDSCESPVVDKLVDPEPLIIESPKKQFVWFSEYLKNYYATSFQLWTKMGVSAQTANEIDRYDTDAFLDLFEDRIIPDTTKMNFGMVAKCNVYALDSHGSVYNVFMNEAIVMKYSSSVLNTDISICMKEEATPYYHE